MMLQLFFLTGDSSRTLIIFKVRKQQTKMAVEVFGCFVCGLESALCRGEVGGQAPPSRTLQWILRLVRGLTQGKKGGKKKTEMCRRQTSTVTWFHQINPHRISHVHIRPWTTAAQGSTAPLLHYQGNNSVSALSSDCTTDTVAPSQPLAPSRGVGGAGESSAAGGGGQGLSEEQQTPSADAETRPR